MPKYPSEEHARPGECFIQGYDSSDQAYPIVARKVDPRETGYDIPANLAVCTDTRYSTHQFVGVVPILDDRRVLWMYMILPGPYTPFTRYDDALGPIQGRRRLVANSNQAASLTPTVKTTYEAWNGSDIVSWEIEEINSDGTGADGAATNPAYPVRFEDTYEKDARGPVQTMSQLVRATGGEAGSLALVELGIYLRTITNGGSGYTSAPTVTFTGAGATGTGATAIVTLTAGVVTGLFITNPGTGYVDPITVSVSGGGGSGAVITANSNPLIVTTEYVPYPENRFLLEKRVQIFLPSQVLLSSHTPNGDGTVTTVSRTLKPSGDITRGEEIDSGFWAVTSSEPWDTQVSWEVQTSRPVPGGVLTSTRIDDDSAVVTVTRQLVEASTITSGESISGGQWIKVTRDGKDNNLVAYEVTETRPIPGNEVVDDFTDDARGAVHSVTLLTNDIATVGSVVISGSTLTKTSFKQVSDLVRIRTIETWAVTRRYGYEMDDSGIGTITEAHVVPNGTRGGVDYPAAYNVTTATTTGGASGTLTAVTVVLPGTGAVPGATFTPLGGTSSPNPSCTIVTTTVVSAAVPTAGSGYRETDVLTGAGGTFTTAATFAPATLKLVGGSIGDAGTGLTGTGTITLAGGTASTPADLNVTSLQFGAAALLTAGTGWATGDTFRFEGGTYTSRATGTVLTTGLVSAALVSPGTGITAGQVLTLRDGTTTTTATITASTIKLVTLAINAAGTFYVEGDTITLTGGTFSTAAVLTVSTLKLVSLAINAGGTGYAVNDTITLAGGTFSTAAVLTVTAETGGAITAFNITTAGNFTVTTATPTQGSTSGVGTGATFQTGRFGILTLAISTAGSYTVGTATPTQGSTSGSGTGATFQTGVFGLNTFTVSAPGSFPAPNPTTLSCLGADPTFGTLVFGVSTWEFLDRGIYTAGTASYTTTVLTGSGTGLTFNTGTFGALAASITTAGNYTVTSETLTHSSGLTWIGSSYGILTVSVIGGGSYTANTASMTLTNSGSGTGAALGTIAYGIGTASVTSSGTFTVFPASFTTSGLGGATLTPFWSATTTGATTITVSSVSGFAIGFDVTFSGTDSVPTLNGTHKVTAISGSTITVALPLHTAPTTGTVRLAAEIQREVQRINDTYAIQGSAQTDVSTLAASARTTSTFVPYDFPNKCVGIEQFTNVGYSANAPQPGSAFPNPCSIHFSDGFSYGPAVAVQMVAGPNIPLAASVAETYSISSPTLTETPLRIYLSTIELVKMGGSINNGMTIAINSDGNTQYINRTAGRTISYSVDSVPHCLTGSINTSGSATAVLGVPKVAVRVTPSSPTSFQRNQTFIHAVNVSRGERGLFKKTVVTLTTPSSGGPSGYFQ